MRSRPSRRRAGTSIAIAAAALALLVFCALASASKEVVSYFGGADTPAGSLGGAGIAINTTGAGPAEAGEIYVLDGSRVVRLDSEGRFVSAWGANVESEGALEEQLLEVNATAGTFKLSFEGAETPALPYNATEAEVQSALRALPSVGGSNVVVEGSAGHEAGSRRYLVAFVSKLVNNGTYNSGSLGATNVPQIGLDTTLLTGTATISTLAQGSGEYQICTVASECRGGKATGGANASDTAKNGSLSSPQSIAVDEDTGNVYVSDRGNRRINEYDGEGNFVRSFGWGVDADVPGYGYEVCPAAHRCRFGLAGSGLGQFGSGNFFGASFGIAASPPDGNPATGEVFLADTGNQRVDTFNLDGSSPGELGFAATFESGQPTQVAVDSRGIVYASNSKTGGEVERYDTEDANGEGVGFLSPILAQLDETQKVSFSGFSTGDTFTLTCPNGEATAPIEYATTFNGRNDILGALEAKCGAGSFSVSGNPPNTTVTFEGAFAATDVPTMACATVSGSGSCSVTEEVDGSAPGPLLAHSGNAASATKGLAVDPEADALYVLRRPSSGPTVVQQLDEAGLSTPPATATEEHGEGAGFGSNANALGLDYPDGTILVAASEAIGELSASGRVYVLGDVGPAPTASIAGVSEVGAHGATVNGSVNPNGSPGGFAHTFYRIAFKRPADSEFSYTPQYDAGGGETNVLVSKRLASLEAGTTYEVKIVAERPFGTGSAETEVFSFSTPAAAAEVGTPAATSGIEAGEVRAALYGQVYPNSQATSYRFEYGTTTSYGTKSPAADEALGDSASNVPVARFLSGLQPDTTYHFRLFAHNPSGSEYSPDATFTTPPLTGPGGCPNEARRAEQGATGLPDCRAYEKVSPDKEGSAALSRGVYPTQIPYQASPGGGAFLYPLQGGLADSTAGGYLRLRATRTAAGWRSAQLSGPSLIKAPELAQFVPASNVRFATPGLGCAIVETYNPLTADTPQIDVEEGVFNLYRRNADGSWELITNRVPLNPELVAGSYYSQLEASDDCRRVFFSSSYEFIAGASGLYEWDEGTLRDAGALPDGSAGAGAFAGGETDGSKNHTSRWNAVSPGGGRFFFSAIADEGADAGARAVFMRSGGGEAVADISQSKTSVPTAGARFEAASPDGGTAIFSANYGIAASSSAGPTDGACDQVSDVNIPPIEAKPCDLYAYDAATGDLTDLSADPNAADPIGAAVQGAIAVSEDGSRVYFAALGQLVPGRGNTYAENAAGEGAANVYLSQGGALSYVTTLSRADLYAGIDGGTAAMRIRNHWSAKVSADGRELAFESASDLAGYEGGGGRALYLYSADTGGLGCASCRLDGQPTLVEEDGAVDNRGDAPNLLPSARLEVVADPPAALSAGGGRLFFTSPDALAPGAVSGRRNVYEWEAGRVRFLAIGEVAGESSAPELGGFLATSSSGDDAYIATNERYVPEDLDFVNDVYDVRVDGGFAPEAIPAPCDVAVSGCQGPPAPAPAASGAKSAGFAGEGNLPGGAAGSRSCGAPARQAKRLSLRARKLTRNARRIDRHNHRKAVRLNRKAHRLAKRAGALGKRAKRCRRANRNGRAGK